MNTLSISELLCYRIRTAPSNKQLRTPLALQNAERTGSLKTAIHSAVRDIEAMGEGAAFLIEHYSDAYGWTTVHCGEVVDGRYVPRNNF